MSRNAPTSDQGFRHRDRWFTAASRCGGIYFPVSAKRMPTRTWGTPPSWRPSALGVRDGGRRPWSDISARAARRGGGLHASMAEIVVRRQSGVDDPVDGFYRSADGIDYPPGVRPASRRPSIPGSRIANRCRQSRRIVRRPLACFEQALVRFAETLAWNEHRAQ